MVREQASCGVGFNVSLKNHYSHETLRCGLEALENLEHRGGTGPDLISGDGAGIMTDIPRALLGIRETDALANLFLSRDDTNRARSLKIFEETFKLFGLEIIRYRTVPVDLAALSPALLKSKPEFLMAVIRRPDQCSTRHSFEKNLYEAKQLTRSSLRKAGIVKQFFFTSLSASTVVYKALTTSANLAQFYLDLQSQAYVTRYVLFHRRFSTNTATAWDTAQPFRMVAHNGEINTISGNRSWAFSRERALGLREDELLTHAGISDSGSVNEMSEALTFRSSIPHPEDILAIMMPQADNSQSYYRFWSRAMEPWDGPALMIYSDGRTIGARLDRSGFRPCRWARTEDYFYLSSEAGSFGIDEGRILQKGCLTGGASAIVNLERGDVSFKDASQSRENLNATFDPRLVAMPNVAAPEVDPQLAESLALFGFTQEDLQKVIRPLLEDGREGVGSMGDTARLPFLSTERRSLYDFFYQRFAQVTNPPLDFLRERIVTDVSVVLGQKPNIFEPKDLVPMKAAMALDGPVLSLGQVDFLKSLNHKTGFESVWPETVTLSSLFAAADGVNGVGGWNARLDSILVDAVSAVRRNVSILIVSDRGADEQNPAIPAVIVLRAILQEMNRLGMRLRLSVVLETGDAKDTHSLAVLTAFGAAAVCPYLLLDLARQNPPEIFKRAKTAPAVTSTADEREQKLVKALETGILKVMSKVGISVFRSYQGSELFTILGFSKAVHDRFFPGHQSVIGGMSIEQLVEKTILRFSNRAGFVDNHLYQEDLRKPEGELHSMTLARSKMVHRLVTDSDTASALNPQNPKYADYVRAAGRVAPISVRHLLRTVGAKIPVSEVASREAILKTFGSGAMSFGAISAESQRDIFLAMAQIGGRSNSGEGGENPYYHSDGICAHTKQLASGRFGVTAEYLVTGKEVQIKISQGAKPGEGGQLMAVKVDEAIARARFSNPGVDLISPPPMHDIYSIEDLKQLIFEIRQLAPHARISVKLVSGENIGAIAVGVAKAGADIIQISGHDGGTGASPLSSMKHAGLPWEFGLWECHEALSQQGMRESVTLRVDGGLFTGEDVIAAAILGAEEFDFGKLLLIAEGCIMARICEKNTCPTGIATHDPKYKRLYRGSKDRVVKILNYVAEDVREQLGRIGATSLGDLVGRTDLLEIDPQHAADIERRGLNFDRFLAASSPMEDKKANPYVEAISSVNAEIVKQTRTAEEADVLEFNLQPYDRAVLATLCGELATSKRKLPKRFEFHGSAGQGFGIFLQDGMNVRLRGEANDSVGKSMSGGRLTIVAPDKAKFAAYENAIIGNCALYGATGGTLYVNGLAGARFAVRNSGATAVIEGVGIHACEYMTRGTVVILGTCGPNVGAGMTGGQLFVRRDQVKHLNVEYLHPLELAEEDRATLRELLKDYLFETKSETAWRLIQSFSGADFVKAVPLKQAKSIRRDVAPTLEREISP